LRFHNSHYKPSCGGLLTHTVAVRCDRRSWDLRGANYNSSLHVGLERPLAMADHHLSST